MTIEELCSKAGIAPSQLYYLESGKRNIGIETLNRVLNALGADLVEIIEEAFELNG
jgi:Helix-turn-helix.